MHHPFAIRAKADELNQADQWAGRHLRPDSKDLPFSFIYHGKASGDLLGKWTRKAETKKIDKTRTQHTIVWTDTQTSLEVRCVAVEYSDFPVVEWTVYFRNAGKKNTPILENIQGIDTTFHRGEEGEFVLRGIKGDFYSPDSYRPYEVTLKPGSKQRYIPVGGRPTNGEFPYYNLHMPGGGVMGDVFRSRRAARPAHHRRAGTDAPVPQTRRASAHAADRPAVLQRRRCSPFAESLAAMDARP